MKKINTNLATECLKIYNENPAYQSYRDQDSVLKKIFEKYPKNNNLEDILLKVVVLNDFYSTNIMNVYKVAKHILELKIDDKLQNYDLSVVSLIANVDFREKGKKCFYSFATKYCSMHHPDYYPIIDKHVKNVLKQYKNEKYHDFKIKDFADYEKYNKIINAFNKFYDLNLSIRDLDHFLWVYDKEKDGLLIEYLSKI